jgi:hypothetical protein
VEVEAGVRHEAVCLSGLIKVITKMGIADPGVGVLARDGVNLVAVTALLAVELEATGEALDLKHSALNAARTHAHSLLYDKLCKVKYYSRRTVPYSVIRLVPLVHFSTFMRNKTKAFLSSISN